MSPVRRRPGFVIDNREIGSGAKSNDNVVSPVEHRKFPQIKFIWILLSAGVLSAYIVFRRNTSLVPKSYALCSQQESRIYIVDSKSTRTQCIVVRGSYIIDSGHLGEVQSRWDQRDLDKMESSQSPLKVHFIEDGAIVVPGFSDSHAHILEYGASRQLPLEGAKSIQDVVALVNKFIRSDPNVKNDPTKYIDGWGWDHTSWPTEEWPTAEALDADPVVRGRPVVLQSKDGHALWVSSKALELSTPFPETVEGGVIIRNLSGDPTGVLLDNAQDLVRRPALTDKDLHKRFMLAVEDALSYGLTSIHDAGFDPVSLRFFKREAEKGNLPIRIYGMTYFDENGTYWGNTSSPIIGDDNGRFTACSVKIFADGALRSGGAALYEPYADNPSTSGFMRLEPQLLHEVIPRFFRDGWQVNVHAIGDRANNIVLDAFEAALSDVDVVSLRPRLEHAQFMTRSDMERLGRLGVIASIQPTHVISDMWYAENRLGAERVKRLYAFRSLVDSGARITLGSDSPVETLNPLYGFYAAITRVSADGKSPHGPGGWFPEERLTREEALRGMTIDAAYASFSETTLGSLEPGKRADYVVLSQDIMSIPPNEVLNTKVLATVLDGVTVYGRI